GMAGAGAVSGGLPAPNNRNRSPMTPPSMTIGGATMPPQSFQEAPMAQFKNGTHNAASADFGISRGGYTTEMGALGALDAEIVEVTASSEDEFIAAARDADALIAKGRPITRRIIESLERCRVIALGSVGADTVDVAAATARGIPVTNVPDTFIEEV